MRIELIEISKTFGKFRALDHVSLTIHAGEFVALLGPSGSGKTTLLRIIAGLDLPDPGAGRLLFDGKDVTYRPADQRGVGFVFQHYALFRHMTVYENIAFGLRVQRRRLGLSTAQIDVRVRELLRLIQLEPFAERYPHQLSGGQRQRVALARALAIRPRVLLLDEPFGALDAKVRRQLRTWLRGLHDEIGLTSVFVTHDQEEALELADRVVVLNAGRVEQVGTPEEVYHQPQSAFVIEFIGTVNKFRGIRRGSRVEFGTSEALLPGEQLAVFVRPHEFTLSTVPHRHAFPAVVQRVHTAGGLVKLWLTAQSGETFLTEIDPFHWSQLTIKEGDTVYVTARQLRCFSEEGQPCHPAERFRTAVGQ
jgi:sulfate transport system ATP-binding protein